MYDLNDTIVAVSSGDGGARVIVRICGAGAFSVCRGVCVGSDPGGAAGVFDAVVRVAESVEVQAKLYVYVGPRSYTGEDMVEIHFAGSHVLAEALVESLLASGDSVRSAGPGEFTARAYLNGKLDIAQAEAVGELIGGSNRVQLAAAERLLSGRLSAEAAASREAMIDCLSLIEAGLDFSEEDIEFISRDQAGERLGDIKGRLEGLLAGSIRCESLINLPSVGIAGAPNAGKSSLLNSMLGEVRSIVSDERKTTRDVLTGELTLDHSRCVLFDCAGLVGEAETILDDLAQAAAVEALGHAAVVLFCVDLSKDEWGEDEAICRLVRSERVLGVATKADVIDGDEVRGRCERLGEVFGFAFEPVSAVTGAGLEGLGGRIDDALVDAAGPDGDGRLDSGDGQADWIAMTVRHRLAVVDAIENIDSAVRELVGGDEEVVAMMIRSAHQCLTGIEQPGSGRIDDDVLERIFGSFCIGK